MLIRVLSNRAKNREGIPGGQRPTETDRQNRALPHMSPMELLPTIEENGYIKDWNRRHSSTITDIFRHSKSIRELNSGICRTGRLEPRISTFIFIDKIRRIDWNGQRFVFLGFFAAKSRVSLKV